MLLLHYYVLKERDRMIKLCELSVYFLSVSVVLDSVSPRENPQRFTRRNTEDIIEADEFLLSRKSYQHNKVGLTQI